MSSDSTRPMSVGSTVEDLCRPCKSLRRHTVMSVAMDRVRVLCDTCGSQHNYRGAPSVRAPSAYSGPDAGPVRYDVPFDPVSERERRYPPMSLNDASVDLELLLRRVMREESGLTPVAPAAKWRGGELVLRPERGDVQEKSWPIETFFQKIVMLRNRLRTLEQQINSAEIPNDTKLKLQGYITGCYGTLSSFNVLFADDDDRFKGSGGKS